MLEIDSCQRCFLTYKWKFESAEFQDEEMNPGFSSSISRRRLNSLYEIKIKV